MNYLKYAQIHKQYALSCRAGITITMIQTSFIQNLNRVGKNNNLYQIF